MIEDVDTGANFMEHQSTTEIEDDDTVSLHDNIVTQLRELLLNGQLTSGAKVPEAALCRRFGVSRTPLREALKVLASEGFLILRPNRGAIVAPIDPTAIIPILEVKGALERLIGLTVPERLSETEFQSLEEIHQNLRTALERNDHSEYTRLNYEFHKGLCHAARNPILSQIYESLQQKLWRFRFAVNEHYNEELRSFTEHERIMTALRARTRLDLAERLEEHNRQTGLAMMEALTKPHQA